jgi:hypothetical protein
MYDVTLGIFVYIKQSSAPLELMNPSHNLLASNTKVQQLRVSSGRGYGIHDVGSTGIPPAGGLYSHFTYPSNLSGDLKSYNSTWTNVPNLIFPVASKK